MKKNILLTLLTLSGTAVLFMTGCSKDDTTPPAISITGATSDVVSLGGTWTDPGATATDDEDGSVSVSSDASATNPNTNLVGTYTVTYSATDAAGNVGTAVRTVRVKNDAEMFAGTYSVNDVVVGGGTFVYSQTITVDDNENYKVHFSKFGNYANNTDIYGMMNAADSTLSIPNQSSGHDIGTNNGGQCDVVRHNFRTKTYQKLINGFTIHYVDSLTTGGSVCEGSASEGDAQFSK